MADFFQWLSSGSLPSILFMGIISLIVLSVASIYVGAFVQGRQISFWPPKIGEKPDSEKGKSSFNSKKGKRITTLLTGKDFAEAKYKHIVSAEKHVYDMELCLSVPLSNAPQSESSSRKLLNQRVMNDELTYKFVQVIYDRTHFESMIRRLLRFHKHHYYIGYFIGAPDVIPVLNVMIFDEQHFFIGGYYGPSVRGEDSNLYTNDEAIGQTLRQYFNYLWGSARLLNEKRTINWDEVRHCGLKMGYSLEELNITISQIANELGISEINVLQ